MTRDGVTALLGALRRRRAHGLPAADLVDRALARLEAADPVPRTPLPRPHVRRSRQWPFRSSGGRRGVRDPEFAADAIAVMDATGTASAALVGALLRGAVGDDHGRHEPRAGRADRLHRARGPARAPITSCGSIHSFDDELDTDAGWAKYNRHYWLRDYEDFVASSQRKCLHEPHSTQADRGLHRLGARDRPPATLVDTIDGLKLSAAGALGRTGCRVCAARRSCSTVRTTRCARTRRARRWPRATGGALVTLEGSGHLPEARDPVRVNLLLHDFLSAGAERPPRRFRRAPHGSRVARCTSPRRSALGMRAAILRSRGSCAGSVPIWRSTGWLSTR